jgi:hypothetical protein
MSSKVSIADRSIWLRALVVALAMALAAVPLLARADQTSSQAAQRALAFLAANQLPDGSLSDQPSQTEDWILGTVANGGDPNQLVASSGTSAYAFLIANVASATTNANRTGKLIQAVVAGHRDPHNFGGQNLLLLMEGPGATAGGFYNPATGAFDNGRDIGFAQANAILGLVVAADPSFPVTALAVTFLKSQQTQSGPGAGGYKADGVENTNSTAMALMALAAVNDHSTDALSFGFLHRQQDAATGGFTFTTLAFSSVPDPDSDALVIQALVADGQDPRGPVWTISGRNALTNILTFQDPASGGFAFTLGQPPQVFATSEVPAGLLEAPFPILPRH